MTNRLADATSPYLLQHQDNPVDWWPWCDEAFAASRRRDVPVFVSIGYAACHWCHVMAHESFEDTSIATYLNERFVSIKVDREERPDVDAAYIAAAQAMTGQAGWPLSVFVTPDGRPFYVGTYFPPRPLGGTPSFRQVLEAVATAWERQHDEIMASAERISAHLAAATPPGGRDPTPADGRGSVDLGEHPGSAEIPTADDLHAAVVRLASEYDEVHGGFGAAPKFPPSTVLEFLARHHARTGDPTALDLLAGTCRAMATGGIYDQLGGGFARYAVDAGWVVPHFEKMLYDNALLLRTYLHWWRLTGDPMALRVVRETAEFLLTDLRTPQGGFGASLDADTVVASGPSGHRRVEGATYAWSPEQLAEALGPADAGWAAGLLGVTEAGTFEHGTSTLRLTEDLDRPDADPTHVQRWRATRDRLRIVRARRPAPERDDKVVACWNGYAIAALAEAGGLLAEPRYVEAARTAAQLLLRVHLDADGELRRTSRDGHPGVSAGVLEDYGALAEGMLVLYAVTGTARWFDAAQRLVDVMTVRFAVTDHTGQPSLADVAPEDVDARLATVTPPGRVGDITEGPTPSGRSVASAALLAYSALTGSTWHRALAEAALDGARSLLPAGARWLGGALTVAEAMTAGPVEIAVVGDDRDPQHRRLHDLAVAALGAGAVVALGPPGTRVPALLADRGLVGGRSAAYVCRGFVCQMPTTDPAELADQLSLPAHLRRGPSRPAGLRPSTTAHGGHVRGS